MALMQWDSTYSVGIPEIDRQHQGLMAALNELHAAMTAGQANPVTAHLLADLLRYTRDHFRAEEALLARAAYPELQAHAAIHVRLTKHVEKFIQRMESGEKALSVHLLVFLRDWLSIHILREDRAYSAWLQSCSSR